MFNLFKPKLKPNQTRVLEVVFGDGSKKYTAQATTQGHKGLVWGGIAVHDNKYNPYSPEAYEFKADPSHMTFLTKEQACQVCRDFLASKMAKEVVSMNAIECCSPRKIN